MTDYEQAKKIYNELKINKQTTIKVEEVALFRRYLSGLCKDMGRKYATKVINDGVLVIRVA